MLGSVWKLLLPILVGEGGLSAPKGDFLGNLGGLGSLANEAYKNLLSSYNPQTYENFYNSSFVSPIKRTLQEEIIPQIKNQFLSGDEKGSSALNQVLAQSIQQAALRLGEGLMGGYNESQRNTLQALSQLLKSASMSSQNTPSAPLGGLLGSFLEGGQESFRNLGERAGDKMMNFLTQRFFK